MKLKMIIHNFDEQMISIGASAYYWNRTAQQEEKTRSVGDEIPTIESVFDLKSGVRAKLVDRSGSMVIIEIDKYRSDWDRMERGQSKDRGKGQMRSETI